MPSPIDNVQSTKMVCPDGKAHCLGWANDHADPREHIHRGPMHSLSGSYLGGSGPEVDPILTFNLIQWDDDEPQLAFAADGTWPDLDLPQVDELINDLTGYLHKLRATRDQLAQLNGDQPRVLTAADVRQEVSALLRARTHTYETQDGDPRLPAVRALDIRNAAMQGIEDAAVVLDDERRIAEPHREQHSDVSSRYSHRLGTVLVAFQPLFEACFEDAVQRGSDGRQTVAQMARLMAGQLADAANRR